MASANPKKIDVSKIKVIEEIKEAPRTLDTNNSPRDSQIESKPDKTQTKEMIRKLKYDFKTNHGVYVYRCHKCRAWIDFTVV